MIDFINLMDAVVQYYLVDYWLTVEENQLLWRVPTRVCHARARVLGKE
jgi:hypothetical protein